MKVILLKDTSGVGRRSDVVDVSDGFARNQLIPRGLAEPATPKSLAALEAKKERKEDERRLSHTLLQKNIKSLDGKTITLARNANEHGHLFAKIRPVDVVRAIAGEFKIEIPSSVLEIKEINELGTHPASLKDDGVFATLSVVVQAQ